MLSSHNSLFFPTIQAFSVWIYVGKTIKKPKVLPFGCGGMEN